MLTGPLDDEVAGLATVARGRCLVQDPPRPSSRPGADPGRGAALSLRLRLAGVVRLAARASCSCAAARRPVTVARAPS